MNRFSNSAFEYLQQLWPCSLCELIALETNRYAMQKGRFKWNNTTTWKFLGISILMGIHRLPRINNYRSRDKFFGLPVLRDYMSHSRFWSLWTNLHVVDYHSLPATRGLSRKVKPVLDTLGRTFLGIRAKDLLAFRLELVRTMLDTVGGVRAVSNAHVDTAQNEGVCHVERLCDIGLKRGRCLQCVLSKRKPPHYTSFGCRVCRLQNWVFSNVSPKILAFLCYLSHVFCVFWMYMYLLFIKIFVKMCLTLSL